METWGFLSNLGRGTDASVHLWKMCLLGRTLQFDSVENDCTLARQVECASRSSGLWLILAKKGSRSFECRYEQCNLHAVKQSTHGCPPVTSLSVVSLLESYLWPASIRGGPGLLL